MCEAIGFENNEEEIVCAWIMELVQAISINLLNNRFVNSHENSQKKNIRMQQSKHMRINITVRFMRYIIYISIVNSIRILNAAK